ncbi:cupin domain-containing protein [Streptomyces polychromogenes]|uniref:Cupin domain-containing protein n=1 Tax=Streptomyces polychromogenes TaxID=67342 RepID=A0ABN0V1G3_9ACTN
MSPLPIQRRDQAPAHQEHGCTFRRVLPWDHSGPSDTGMGICTVPPATRTVPHSHQDLEHFYVARGKGRVHVDGEATDIGQGDAFIIGAQQVHHFETPDDHALELVSIWSQTPFGTAG